MIDAARLTNNKQLEEARIKSQSEIAGMNVGQRIASDLLDREEKEGQKVKDDVRFGLDIAKDLVNDINLNE